jgi:hypothetical protein
MSAKGMERVRQQMRGVCARVPGAEIESGMMKPAAQPRLQVRFLRVLVRPVRLKQKQARAILPHSHFTIDDGISLTACSAAAIIRQSFGPRMGSWNTISKSCYGIDWHRL